MGATASPTPPPPFRRQGLGYVYEPKDSQIRFRMDHLKRHGEEIHGVLTVETTLPGVRPHLHEANHNIGSLTARTTLVKHLSSINPETPWRDYVEAFCVLVMRHEREGEPFQEVGDMALRDSETDALALLLPYRRMTWLFGEEGSGKGTLAVAWMVAVATGDYWLEFRGRKGNVAYLDWEDDAETMDRRIKAVCAGAGVDPPTRFLYRHCSGALHGQVNAIARQFDAMNIEAYVIDSAVLASGVGSDHGDAADAAHGLVEALRILNRTALVIDHVTKASTTASGPAKPYGSVMKRAWARQAWEVKKQQELGETTLSVGLYHNKNNHGVLVKPIGIEIAWSDAGRVVNFKRQDIRDVPELLAKAGPVLRIQNVLRYGPLSIREIADEIDEPLDKVRASLNQSRKFLKLGDRWALAAPPGDTNGSQ